MVCLPWGSPVNWNMNTNLLGIPVDTITGCLLIFFSPGKFGLGGKHSQMKWYLNGGISSATSFFFKIGSGCRGQPSPQIKLWGYIWAY